MSVQPRSLTTTQAVEILEALSLLTSPQHTNSKLVIYETKIELESDSSALRTFKAWALPAFSTAQYLAGYTPIEPGSRNISKLLPLLERVHQVFKDHQYDYDERTKNKDRIPLVEKAIKGLDSLVQHEYLESDNQSGFVKLAQLKVNEILAFFKSSGSFDSEDPIAKQLREKEKEIELLKKEKDLLKGLVDDKERYIAVLSQLFERQKGEISKLESYIVKDTLRDPTELVEVPANVIIGRVHVLTGVLAERRH